MVTDTINGALNQELLQEKHNPNFSVNLDKKAGFGKFQQHKWLCDIPHLLGTLTPTNEHHLRAEEVRRGIAKSAASTTTERSTSSQSSVDTTTTLEVPYHPHPLQWVFIYMCHFNSQQLSNGTHKKNS